MMNLEEKILSALKSVYDPELNINVVDLGLIYNIDVTETANVTITMTLTTPGCPLHDSITSGVRYAIEGIEETRKVDVNMVWEPAWSPERMTPEGLRLLGR
jgi:metal-sulfur cluster biosynthetic enzyme